MQPPPSAFGDRRTNRRSYMVRSAWIVNGVHETECVLLDASQTGVRLYHPDPACVPERVSVRMRATRTRPGRVCWRGWDMLGIEFTD